MFLRSALLLVVAYLVFLPALIYVTQMSSLSGSEGCVDIGVIDALERPSIVSLLFFLSV